MKKTKSLRIKSKYVESKLLSLVKRAEDFFVPPLCVICNGSLVSDRWMCNSCLDKLNLNHNTRNACSLCSQNGQKRVCACEFAWDYPFQKIFSVYDYDETLSSIAQHIKYKGKKRLAYHIGGMCSSLIPSDYFNGVDMVIPVPLHKSRMRKRGYNQSEWFARGVLKGADKKLLLRTDLLTRIKNTGTQTALDREERQSNLAGAFAVNFHKKGELRDKVIVLADDILTTGATVEACTEELLKADCASVKILSMGRD
ncbi:MAG: hypothetical protein FWE57_01290 [Chitinispirillia bacterium]|nr:hypothetical protein [Chitinispirillia bacterium]